MAFNLLVCLLPMNCFKLVYIKRVGKVLLLAVVMRHWPAPLPPQNLHLHTHCPLHLEWPVSDIAPLVSFISVGSLLRSHLLRVFPDPLCKIATPSLSVLSPVFLTAFSPPDIKYLLIYLSALLSQLECNPTGTGTSNVLFMLATRNAYFYMLSMVEVKTYKIILAHEGLIIRLLSLTLFRI